MRGRPSSFKDKYCEIARKACENGATDLEVSEELGINGATLYRWKIKYPNFCEALKAGKEIADNRVERTLYNRAVGYSFDSEKVFQFQGQIVRADTVEHVPPDTTAAIFWLKNRKPEQWRDTQRHEHDVTAELGERLDRAIKKLAGS